ncbi:aminotransferase DegT [Alteromonas sp. KUL156]|nr:aminotransferase DegT [Alteromonas sp. KUL154]GFE02088.1 aminotransferase DegT [Alteromonas sp. KUL156]
MIPVTKAYLPDKQKYKDYVDRIFESGWLTNKSGLLQELESRLALYLGVKHLICVANGTLALQVAYKALNLKGEAITTPFSFPATASSLEWEGVKPIFCDIHPYSFNLDIHKIEALITQKTSAIVPVHVYGNPCDVESIKDIAEQHKLKVVYDAAHAFGVSFTDMKGQSRSVLNYGDISTLSFHATKLFHTVEGGAIITDSDELAEKIRLLINFGIFGESAVALVGTNAKMNEFEAAMGLCILDDIDKITEQRKAVFHAYKHGLSGLVDFQRWHPRSENNHAYAPILLKSEQHLLKVQSRLKEVGIAPRRYFYPSLDTLSCFQNTMDNVRQEVSESYCHVSSNIANRILCLPIYPSLEHRQVDKIIHVVKTAISS